MTPMTSTLRSGLLGLGLIILAGCASTPTAVTQLEGLLPLGWDASVAAADDVETLAQRYLELNLAMDPTGGVSFGLHGMTNDPTLYDRSLPDDSPAALNRAHQRLAALESRLTALNEDQLGRDALVDRRILLNKIRLDMLSLTKLGAARNPLGYVSTLGGAYSGLLLRDFAPLAQRLDSLAARCAATPAYLDQARENLSPEDVQVTAVQKQMTVPRLRSLSSDTGMLRKLVPELAVEAALLAPRRIALEQACTQAAQAIDEFAEWFEATVAPRPDKNWRLGPSLFGQKYAYYMDFPLGPDQLLAKAEQHLAVYSQQLIDLSRKIHDAYLAEEIRAGQIKPARGQSNSAVIRNVLAKMSEDRPTPDSLIEDSYALADSIVGFVKDKDLLDLPPTAKLRIEPIPPHLSGYAVAMIMTAPPFEPHLDSVWFWDLPMLKASEGYLKEYSRPVLAEVYIHEGVPGHFVQLEYSNRAERLVPRVFWNGPMVEGWASYIESQLVDLGYTVYPDHPQGHELQKIANLKLSLRGVINAIIDIRLHTQNWPEERALDLMINRGFQEPAEAQGKLTRAKLSSVQLSSYFAGDYAIREILAEYRKRAGDEFSWKRFNESLLGAGSPPMDVVRERMRDSLKQDLP